MGGELKGMGKDGMGGFEGKGIEKYKLGGELKGMGKDGRRIEGKGIEKYKLGGELKSIHFNLWHQISK